MSYRPRESNVFRAGPNAGPNARSSAGGNSNSNLPQSSTQNPPSSSATTMTKKKAPPPEDDDDILLRDDEIVSCIREIAPMAFTVADLKNPSPTQVQVVYEALVDLLMGVRRERVDALLVVALDGVEHPDTYRESMSIVAGYRSLSRLMAVCDVRDFSFVDLLKPEYTRLRHHLSQVINFMRFRGDAAREALTAEQMGRPEDARAKLGYLLDENARLQSELERVGEQVRRDEPAIVVAKEVNEALTADLRAMKKRQGQLSNEFEKERGERAAVKQALQDRQYLALKARGECEKIRPYIVDSPEKLQQVIVEMNQTLLGEKNLCDTLERRIRALQTSAESCGIVEAEVAGCIKVMEECEQELVKVDEMARKVARHDEILKSRENENKDVERKEALLQRQLENLRERIDRVRAQAEGKREQAQRRMEELKGVYDELSRERGEKSKEMERKKMKIEQIEKKVGFLIILGVY